MKKLPVFLVLALMCITCVGISRAQRWNSQDNGYNGGYRYDGHSPRDGACFYTTAPFRGHIFCMRAGDRLPTLPGTFNGNISSIQIFGHARVRIFNGKNFSNGSAMVRRTIPDLRDLPFRGGHTWNNRISSIIVY